MAPLPHAWSRSRLGELFAGLGTARQRGLLQTVILVEAGPPPLTLPLPKMPFLVVGAVLLGIAARN